MPVTLNATQLEFEGIWLVRNSRSDPIVGTLPGNGVEAKIEI
jgi:hypothetical protein